MKRLFTLIYIIFVFSCFNNIYADIIAQQDFETSPATPVLTYTEAASAGTPGSGTGICTGNSATTDAPASSPLYAGGSRAYRMQGPNSGSTTSSQTITFTGVSTDAFTNINASFRVASMSIGSNGNGIESSIDECLIEVSTDGIIWHKQAKVVTAGSNIRWAFSGTGSGSRAYLANNTFTSISCGTGSSVTVTGASAITTINITNLPSVSDLRIRITLTNNAANESWIIDNVVITGDPTGPVISASPNITGLNYYLGSGPSAAQSFSLSGAHLDPKDDTIYVYAPLNFKISTSSAGTYVDTLKFPYTDSTLATTAVWTKLVAGLAVNSYSDSILISGGTATSKKISVSGVVSEPTISVSPTSITGLNYVLGLGASLPQTFAVSGNTLTPASSFLTVSAPTNFLVSLTENGTYTSSVNINYTTGTLSSKDVYVVLQNGLSIGNYADSITVSGGGAISKKIGIAGSVVPNNCSELFFSEYVEGSSNNRYIEIYNPTSNPIILCSAAGISYYKFCTYSNGSSTATNLKFTNGATVPVFGTYILKNSSASNTVYGGTAQTSIVFDGNDALTIEKLVFPTNTLTNTSNIVDIIGRIGENVFWTSGAYSTSNQTLVRNPSINKGITINPLSGFPTLSTEWLLYNIDEGHFLGSHVSRCQNNNYTIASVNGITITQYCPGETIDIPFTTIGTYTGNTFTALLSNENGSFASPVNIGTLSLNGTNPSGTINATIPLSAIAGTNYHIKISSNSPISGMIQNGQHITINSATPSVVTLPSATQANNSTTLTWKNPTSGCYEQTMVVISTNPSFTFTPTGNGSSYTANSIYGSGIQVVFKDTGSTVNITGLTNGTIYYVKIFTKNGSNWSAEVPFEFLVDPYCYPKYTGSCDEYISRVTLNTLSNSTPAGCGYNGYSWHANKSTTLVKGESYELTVQVGKVSGDSITSYNGDDLRVWIDWNNSISLLNNTSELIIENYNNGASGNYTFTVPLTAVTGSIRMRIQLLYFDSADPTSPCGSTFQDGETEDYTLNIIPACTPTTSTFKFYPEEGSAGTEVRFYKTSGTSGGFLSVDSIQFNGILSPSIRILDDNTMFAIVPEGAGTGVVTLFDNSPCKRKSVINFDFLNKEGTCNIYNDLFISEIYDPIGNNHYIEIFNGTNSDINLTTPNNYTIKILNKDSYGDTKPTINTINITGTIPAGENRVYYAGLYGAKATGSQSSSGTGFNEFDDVILYKNSSVLDRYRAPSTANYNYRRNNTATAPTNTYSAADWTSFSPVNTADIGLYVPISPFEITGQPSDVNGCQIDLTTIASGTGLTYQWYYDNNLTTDTLWRIADSLAILFPLCTVTGATTSHLIVSGDLSQFDNYQFYCKVIKSTCSEYSNVARFKIQPDPYFRSKQSGDWRLASTWETSPNGSDSWSPACTFPWDSNSVSVEIMNGHQVKITDNILISPDVKIDELKILTGGQLKIETKARLDINDGIGTDLLVQGTLFDRGNSSYGITFLNDAKWKLDTNGTIIKTGTSAVVGTYKDQFEGGISTIPASANWIYRKDTLALPNIAASGMFYPNLYFEDVYTGGASYVLTGSGDFMTVKGSLFVGDTGLAVTVSNNNTFSTPMKVLKNVSVGENSTYRIALTPIGKGIEVGGNIKNDGTFDINQTSSGLLRLNGNVTQTISGIGVFDIWNMELDKTAQSLVILDTNIEVKNQLSFSGGIINTQTNILNVSNGDPISAIIGFEIPNDSGVYSDDNYVIGKLRRSIGIPNNIYTFPVGDTVSKMGYNPARLTIRNIPPGFPYATGEFIPQWPGTIMTYRTLDCGGSMKFIEYKGFACDSYWKYEGSSFTNYDIYIHPNIKNANVRPNEETELGHTKTYRALKEVSTQAGKVWDPAVSILGDPCIVSNSFYSIIGASYSGFSIFSPGGGDGNTTALPIQLLYFNVDCFSDVPILKWATASELNSDFFTLEKSSDGIHFSPFTHVQAAGNSNQKIEYSYPVLSFDIDNYYRLVETDLDGSQFYHGIRSQDCKTLYNNSYVYYQPYKGITAQFNSNQLPISIEVFDASGRLMSNEKINKSTNHHYISSSTNWAKGIYFVRMQYSNNEIKTEKVAVY
jgi:hypothetical protein